MATKEKFPFQLFFIQKVRETMPSNHSLADELADLLGVSTDSAYRRIRGETAISIDECVKICDHYKITFDYFNNRSNGSVTFNYHSLDNGQESFDTYLKAILADLVKINNFKNKQIIFAADDVPIFHHFNYPMLTAFKLFYWNKAILNVPELEGKKFDLSLVNDEMMAVAKQIFDLYCKIPSIEIWTDDTINSTLKQIEFYWEAGLFTRKEDAITICEQIEQTIQTVQKQAEMSSKITAERKSAEWENNFMLYNSEVMIGNNCILVNVDDTKATYLSHHTFNSMITVNSAFCNETEAWLKNLIRKSIPISGVAEKQRYQFFKKAQDEIDKVRAKIS